MTSITIEEDWVRALSPEGQEARMPLRAMLECLQPRRLSEIVWPGHVKHVCDMRSGGVVVHETPPGVHNLKWITERSPAPFGPAARYRSVRIALPYVIVVAVFKFSPDGRLVLGGANECFFSNEALTSLENILCYPALLNCSRFHPSLKDRPLSWICTQFLDRSEFEGIEDQGKRARASLEALVRHLLQSGFNRSSDEHELASWYTETLRAKVDSRISSMKRWEKATEKNPFFVEQVPWLSTDMSLRKTIERIRSNERLGGAPRDAASLARIVFNHAP
ncbi:MAG: hypothetical protein ACE5F1_02285 [Planctomycetota bacterium]